MLWVIILGFVSVIVTTIFDLLPNIPSLPQNLMDSLNSFFDLIFSNLSILGFFIRIETIKVIVPLLLIVVNFEHIYKFAMWVLHKIPFINIK